MKRLLFSLAITVTFLYSCHEESPVPTSNEVQFTFDVEQSANLPEKISVDMGVLSIRGEAISKNVSFTRNGNSYISQPVPMPPGSYTLNDFLIVDHDLSGDLTIDRRFTVSGQGATTVSMGRLQLKTNGKNNLLIAVYTHDGAKTKLTDAKLTIYSGYPEETPALYEYMLSARTNRIEFKGDPQEWYYFIIEKEGYVQYINVVSYAELESKRLEVTLQKLDQPGAIAFQPSATCFGMWLEFIGRGSVTLDWGKGEIEVIHFNVDPENLAGTALVYRESCYAISLPPAQITGDVDLIRGITFENSASALNADVASNLQKLVIIDPEMQLLDLKMNSELTMLTITGGYVGTIILPEQHDIRTLTLSPGYDWPSMPQVDYIIDNIHTNAVAANITGGSIVLNGVPVSEQSTIKLNELVNSYGWSVQY